MYRSGPIHGFFKGLSLSVAEKAGTISIINLNPDRFNYVSDFPFWPGKVVPETPEMGSDRCLPGVSQFLIQRELNWHGTSSTLLKLRFSSISQLQGFVRMEAKQTNPSFAQIQLHIAKFCTVRSNRATSSDNIIARISQGVPSLKLHPRCPRKRSLSSVFF